jgi:hypothetical protein
MPRRIRVAIATVILFAVTTACSSGTGTADGEPTTQPSTDRMVVKLLSVEDPRVGTESFADENGVVVSVACAKGLVPLPLVINGTTRISSVANVMTTATASDATIEPTGEISSVRALVVNGVHATHISDDVAHNAHTSLRLNASEWRVTAITSLTFCLEGRNFNVPIPSRQS